MKKVLFALLLVTAVFASCTKEETIPMETPDDWGKGYIRVQEESNTGTVTNTDVKAIFVKN